MTITITEVPERKGSWELNSQQYETRWNVETDQGSYGPFDILDAVWQILPLEYAGTQIHTLTCEQVSLWCWTAHGTWRNLTPEEKEKSQIPNPLDRPTALSYGTRETEKLAEWDINDEAIVNKAGDFFNPSPVIRHGKAVVVARKNYGNFDPQVADAYVFKTNSNSMFGYSPYQLLCTSISAEQQSESVDGEELIFYQITFEFEVDTESDHTLNLVNQGYRELNDDDELVRIKDAEGEDVAEPALLDDDGHKLPADDDPLIIEFDVYNSANFGVFGL